MTLVNLTINGLQIYSVKSPIHQLVPYQPPAYMVPVGVKTGGSRVGGPRTAGLYPLAGLLDYEDTRLKTLSRVRMGLYLAWKAS